MKPGIALSLIFCFFLLSCNGDTLMEPSLDQYNYDNVKLNSLFTKKIFFGHMSVGNNIIDGINDLKNQNPLLKPINVKDFDPDNFEGVPGLYHYMVGNNSDPIKKMYSFTSALELAKTTPRFDIIALKFCYVDIVENTDITQLFSEYVVFVKNLRNNYPDSRIVHITTPLTVHHNSFKGYLKTLIKGDPTNRLRSEFNEMLLEKFGGIDPVFDLAKVESTYPDGSRSTFKQKGKIAYSLINEYTYDRGHLNEIGRKIAASEFLRILSETAYSMDKGGINEDL